jgi:hypothetical protein
MSAWNTIKKSYILKAESSHRERKEDDAVIRHETQVRSLNRDRYGLIRLNLFEHKGFEDTEKMREGTENQ